MSMGIAVLVVELPFPPAELSPNKRLHWAKKASLTRIYRTACMFWTNRARPQEEQELKWPYDGEIPISVTFFPPDNRRRDRDNMLASFKAGFDGIADALGVDDNRFIPTHRVGEVVKGGKVLVEITP